MNWMNKIFCWFRGVWDTATSLQYWQGGHPIDGCSFREEGTYKNCTVQVLKCDECGKVSIAWTQDKSFLSHKL